MSCILLLNGCAQTKPEAMVPDKFAVVSLTEVIKGHYLYSDYQAVQEKITQLQNLQKMQEEMSRKQLTGLDKFYAQTQENQGKFNETLFQTKLLEKQVALEKKLNKKRQELQITGKEQLLAKRTVIEEKYKLEMFNLRTQQQLLNNSTTKFRNEQDRLINQETQKKLVAEQESLKQKIEQEMLLSIKEQEQATEKELQPDYQQAQRELAAYAQKLRGQIKQEGQKSLQGLEVKLQKLPENIQDVLVGIQQEIDNLQKKREYLYQTIYQDVENQATKIALEQGYTVVFKEVRANIMATDITEQVQAILQKSKEKNK